MEKWISSGDSKKVTPPAFWQLRDMLSEVLKQYLVSLQTYSHQTSLYPTHLKKFLRLYTVGPLYPWVLHLWIQSIMDQKQYFQPMVGILWCGRPTVCIILCHLIKWSWGSTDFYVCGDPGTNSLQILGDDCVYFYVPFKKYDHACCLKISRC